LNNVFCSRSPYHTSIQQRQLSAIVMDKVRVRGRGNGVFTPKDFLDLGSRAAIDRALSRLVVSGQLRRIGRGFYDFPR
jgi:Transcriptional regulator, AbiEi antitoxin